MSCKSLVIGLVIIGVIAVLCIRFEKTNQKCGFTTKIIKELTVFNGRKPGTIDHYHAHLYLLGKVKELEKYGTIEEVAWAPGYVQTFIERKDTQGNPIHGHNIVFLIKGESSNKIIVMAHTDHLGEGFPGANDNGSGVFGLLQVAKRMSIISQKKQPKNDILFVLTDCEETTFHGSHLIYNRFPFNNLVINIDTIGGFPDGRPVQIANDGNFSEILKEKAKKLSLNIELVPIQYGRSDIKHFLHNNTCVEFGFPTNEGKLHSPHDTFENLHINNMNKVIGLAGDLVEHCSYSFPFDMLTHI